VRHAKQSLSDAFAAESKTACALTLAKNAVNDGIIDLDGFQAALLVAANLNCNSEQNPGNLTPHHPGK